MTEVMEANVKHSRSRVSSYPKFLLYTGGTAESVRKMIFGCGGQDLNLAAYPNKIAPYCLYPSITALGPRRNARPNLASPPSTQFDLDLANTPSNPVWRLGGASHEA